MGKIIFVILASVFIFLSTPVFVFAVENFKTDYKVTYNVLENTVTHVTFDIALTNTSSQYFASSYNMQVGFKNIENVLASDPEGKIIPIVTKDNDGNNIKINFNKKVVGLDRKIEFTISFDTNNIVQKSGKIWDINIPRAVKQKKYNSFDVRVIVPKSLGNPSYIKPEIGKLTGNSLNFTKNELGESGISISYGNEEIYDFDLTYHLKNSNLFPINSEIALPPSTNYQDVEISSINPPPVNVRLDKDGNWIAQYNLPPFKKLEIKVRGKAKISLRGKKEKISKEQFDDYLKEKIYWQTNSEMKSLALKLKTPYEIYKYVVKTLTYDFSRVKSGRPRAGALEVFKNPTSAVCLEFTDLFIALARAAGIPAREVNGFAYTQNSKDRPLSLVKDVLHAWPEYYDADRETWVMIDPTWENTTGGVDYFHTFDFDHFAFVIKGVSSTYPIPAGGYKISDNQATKDISVEFGNGFDQTNQTLSASLDFSENYFPFFDIRGNILIRNTSNILSAPQEISVTAGFLEPTGRKIYFGSIPPFGSLSIPVNFKNSWFLTNKTDTIRIAINENYISKKINISPFIVNKWTIIGGVFLVSTLIGISIIINKTRNLPLFKQKK